MYANGEQTAEFVGIGYLLYRGLVRGVGYSMTGERALEELRIAYARGDLTDEENDILRIISSLRISMTV